MSGNVSQLGNIFEDVAIKAAVRLVATSPISALNGLKTIDGVAGSDGDRILLVAQADQTLNGIWQMSTGNWIRTADANNNTDFIDGTLVPVARGAVNAGQLFQLQCTDSPIVIGTSLLAFSPQSTVMNAQQVATSTSSVAIGLGATSFSIGAGKAFQVTQYVLIYETANPSNSMLAKITSYVGANLGVSVVATSGAGTFADWTIVLVNSPASAGRVPPLGTGNVSGPGSSTTGHLATFADNTGKVLGDSGLTPGTLATRNSLLYGDAGTATIGDAALISGAAPLPYFAAQPNDNLHLVNDATNPTRDINVTPGRVRDDSDVINLQLAATMVKRLDTAWAAGGVAGSPAGACDTGSKGASQTWHIYLIAKQGLAITQVSRAGNVATVTSAGHGLGVGGSVRNYGVGGGFDGLVVITAVTANTYSYTNSGANVGATAVSAFADAFDILASQNYTTPPTMPSGWTAKQCLGSMLTDGSNNIRAVTQIGDRFIWGTSINDVSTTSVTGARVLKPLTVPLGVSTVALFRAGLNAAGVMSMVFTAPQETDQAAGVTAFADLSTGSNYASGSFERTTDTSANIGVRATAAGAFYNIFTYGYRDPRRRYF